MNVFDPYTIKILTELNKAGAKYLIVGGYAVNFHGFSRTTGDIDLWVEPDNNNKGRIIEALRKLNVEDDLLTELSGYDFTKPFAFIDGEAPFRIDFITQINLVKFDSAWEKKIETEIDGVKVAFIHFNDLILSKINTGRPQDKIDIDELQKIQKFKNKK